MLEERRMERSDQPADAARLYLKALAQRRDHERVVLADRDGLLVVATDNEVDTEAVAAIAPLVAHDPTRHDGMLALMTRGAPLRVWNVELDGEAYYLAAVGGEADTPRDANERLRRILL